eukprot:351002-Chlamydomonas_euryale.AAC.18
MPLAAGRSSSRNADGACCCPVITWGAGMADLLARRLVACHAMPPLRPDALDLRGNTQQHLRCRPDRNYVCVAVGERINKDPLPREVFVLCRANSEEEDSSFGDVKLKTGLHGYKRYITLQFKGAMRKAAVVAPEFGDAFGHMIKLVLWRYEQRR